MSKDSLRVPNYLDHILQAINRISRYTENITEAGFLENELVQDAVIRNIEIIGEAARNIERHHSRDCTSSGGDSKVTEEASEATKPEVGVSRVTTPVASVAVLTTLLLDSPPPPQLLNTIAVRMAGVMG
jgi:hypothetical protein